MDTERIEDRYDELMRGFYLGAPPTWLPAASRPLYERESRRRRCELGQVLVARWPATTFAARALVAEDFAQRVFVAWPYTRFVASNVTTGVYFALEAVLGAAGGPPALLDLLRYEALGVAELRVPPRAERVPEPRIRAAGLGPVEVYRFGTAVDEVHARIAYYAAAQVPFAFVRELEVPRRETFVARSPGDVRVVTDAFAADGAEGACAP